MSLIKPPNEIRSKQAFREADAVDQLPKVAGLRRFDECSFDIRQINLLGELLPSLRLSANATNRSVSLAHVELAPDLGQPGKGSYQSYPIYKISRPSAKVFTGAQLELVYQWAELRGERLAELTSQIQIPWRYWTPIVDLNPTSYPRTLELLALAVLLGYHVLQPTKHYLGCPRPASYSPNIQPVIRPRRFEAFPSGHAMEAFLLARLLATLIGGGASCDERLETQLQRLAARIANNRIVAGVHFHIDSVGGRMVAESLAEYFVHRCQAGTSETPGWLPRSFAGRALSGTEKVLTSAFDRHEKMDGADVTSPYFLENKTTQRLDPSLHANAVEHDPGPGLLHRLWAKAFAEWQ